MSSSLRDITESTEAEGRDDTHQRLGRTQHPRPRCRHTYGTRTNYPFLPPTRTPRTVSPSLEIAYSNIMVVPKPTLGIGRVYCAESPLCRMRLIPAGEDI